VYWIGTVYNFCSEHDSLTQVLGRRTPSSGGHRSGMECGRVAALPGDTATNSEETTRQEPRINNVVVGVAITVACTPSVGGWRTL